MTPTESAIFIALLCGIYLIPTIIAATRGHASAWGIFALNLLLGWTGLIWIIALVWSLANKGTATQQMVIVNHRGIERQNPAPPDQTEYMPLIGTDTRACPVCAETIKAAAIKCRFCGEPLNPTLLIQ